MKVAVLGPLCKDINLVSGKQFTRPGGVTYYSGAALGRLGVQTVVIGTCGQDYAGWPAESGVELVRLGAAGTIEFVNEYAAADRDQRTQRVTIHDNRITPAQLENFWPENVDFTILGPLLHGNLTVELAGCLAGRTTLILAAQGMIRYPAGHGGGIVWDHPEKVLPLLPYCEYLALDEKELRFISGQDSLDSGAQNLLDQGAANLIVTRGSRGSLLYIEGRRYEIPAFPPQVMTDPTGAGDSYLAGFIRAIELFDSPRQRGEFAAMTATISLEESGAFQGSTETVLRRLGWQLP